MAEDPNPTPSQPRRHRPRLNELSRETTESDLWDLDADPVPEPAPEKPDDPAPEPDPSPSPEKPVTAADPEPAAESPEEPVAPRPAETAPARAVSPILSRPQRREWIGLAVLAAVCLGVGIWWITGLFRGISTARMGDDQPDFPIDGGQAKVAGAASYWREPIREGDQRDRALAGVAYIPVIAIELSGGSGALRATFFDEHGESVGDVITHSFSNGRFKGNGSSTMEFAGTDGYRSKAEYSGYRVGTERWTVEIREAPSADAPGSLFQPLFTAPLSTERR